MAEVLAVRAEAPRGLPVRFQPEVLEQMRQDLAHLGEYVERVLERDVDWGVTPGVRDPFLWEPGADKLFAAFNCYPRPVILKDEIDEDKKLITYFIMAEAVSRQTGEVVATGIGVASTREGKYGARWVENPLDYGYNPEEVKLRKRADKKTGEVVYRISNPDWGDLIHTLAQMGYKRAKTDCAQSLPGASSALRRLFQGKPTAAQSAERVPKAPERPVKAAGVSEEPPWDEPPAGMTYTQFWTQVKAAGVSEEQVHKVAGVKSLKDWVNQGRTLNELRDLIFQKLGITPPEKGKLL